MNGITNLLKVKVVVVGDAGVGKTSLALRFTENSFVDHYKQTVGASFCSRALDIGGKRIVFQIWDTAGQERFRSLVPMYLRDAEIALVVYDISNHKSFESIEDWLRQLQKYGPQDMRCALIGNKLDLNEFVDVKKEEAEALAGRHSLYFEETSAKSGQNVDTVFTDIGTALLSQERHERLDSVLSITDSYVHKRQSKCCHR